MRGGDKPGQSVNPVESPKIQWKRTNDRSTSGLVSPSPLRRSIHSCNTSSPSGGPPAAFDDCDWGVSKTLTRIPPLSVGGCRLSGSSSLRAQAMKTGSERCPLRESKSKQREGGDAERDETRNAPPSGSPIAFHAHTPFSPSSSEFSARTPIFPFPQNQTSTSLRPGRVGERPFDCALDGQSTSTNLTDRPRPHVNSTWNSPPWTRWSDFRWRPKREPGETSMRAEASLSLGSGATLERPGPSWPSRASGVRCQPLASILGDAVGRERVLISLGSLSREAVWVSSYGVEQERLGCRSEPTSAEGDGGHGRPAALTPSLSPNSNIVRQQRPY